MLEGKADKYDTNAAHMLNLVKENLGLLQEVYDELETNKTSLESEIMMWEMDVPVQKNNRSDIFDEFVLLRDERDKLDSDKKVLDEELATTQQNLDDEQAFLTSYKKQLAIEVIIMFVSI